MNTYINEYELTEMFAVVGTGKEGLCVGYLKRIEAFRNSCFKD